MRRHLLIAAAPLLLLGACASAPGATRADLAAEPPPSQSPYGMYLAGQAAMRAGRSDDASRLLDAAHRDAAGETAIAESAFTAALMSGDVQQAAALAPTAPDASDGVK